MKALFKFIVKLRKFFEPLTWRLFKVRNWKDLPDLMKWDDLKVLNPTSFSQKINTLDYKWDPIKGLLDHSFPLDCPEYFFKDLPSGRDCDDWARIWVCYYLYKHYSVEEWIVTTKNHPFTNSHFVAVVKDTGGYRLLNYRRSNKAYLTVEEALDELSTWNNGEYKKENRLQCLYRRYEA